MKLLLHAIRTNPSHIEEIKIEDVASFSVTDNQVTIIYNDQTTEIIPLRANDGEQTHEWSGVSIFATRIGMKVDFSK